MIRSTGRKTFVATVDLLDKFSNDKGRSVILKEPVVKYIQEKYDFFTEVDGGIEQPVVKYIQEKYGFFTAITRKTKKRRDTFEMRQLVPKEDDHSDFDEIDYDEFDSDSSIPG
ncbi:hypothetical protein HDU86_004174 [Geranomyces michiganensis]|nr:hypothetical protein HDU86_004174 [Geranomyces michiganensis]